MKTVIRLILGLPMAIIGLVWRLVWRLVETFLVLAIVCFGLIYYTNHSDSALANRLAAVTDQLVTFYKVVTSGQDQ
ncbi:hypothetical protein [Streptococcus halichoeri]|uniref:hypothetical protein n=1 Tax=Streptococcus halichoeri TaxID=254785 RepID=UPI0013596ACB|nr:hypothetical protein [Streptococcus halichoeri]